MQIILNTNLNNYRDETLIYKSSNLEVYFNNIKDVIIDYINKYDYIVGCIAWFTDEQLIKSCVDKYVSIIVQKESFLNTINYKILNYDFCNLTLYNNIYLENKSPVRCFGFSSSNSVRPNMHHKFLVLGKLYSIIKDQKLYKESRNNFININRNYDLDIYEKKDFETKITIKDLIRVHQNQYVHNNKELQIYIPEVVITGSYNYTNNATNSIENIIILKDKKVANVFYNEYLFLIQKSEGLNV